MRPFRPYLGLQEGETQGLKAIEKNLALMVFLPEQIRASAEALTGELGQKEASDIIQKNPGVLTIPPESIKQNVGAIVPLSSGCWLFLGQPDDFPRTLCDPRYCRDLCSGGCWRDQPTNQSLSRQPMMYP